MHSGIYKVTNKLNGKIYIGQSSNIEERWKNHLRAKDNTHFHNALQKYGKDNFIWEIIEDGLNDSKIRFEREKFWISFYKSNIIGYNMTSGGDRGGSEVLCKKVKQYDKYGKFIKEYVSAAEAARQNYICHQNMCEHCNKKFPSLLGGYQWKYEDSSKIIAKSDSDYSWAGRYEKQRAAQIERYKNPIEKEKLKQAGLKGAEKRSKQVLCIETGQIYISASEAARQINGDPSSISKVCRGNMKTHKGFHWKYI